MKTISMLLTLAWAASAAAQPAPDDVARWTREASRVTIIRDDWGIPHVYGKTDADAVFGLIYAQAEDDFNRVETNYSTALGRMAEAEGERAIYQDLRARLFFDADSAKAKYAASPAWLQTLMSAWADGLNYYLYKHPQVKPKVITRFEPWMALSFSEGSIGGDIEHVSLEQLRAFYGSGAENAAPNHAEARRTEPSGSNGIAIAPKNTTDHHALLLINPHTSFYFRAEVQVVSDEGLDAYGAVTWGQFFIYQGFNPRIGWMHTTSGANDLSEYVETVVRKGDRVYYRYGGEERPMTSRTVSISYRTDAGPARKTFTVYRTHHGPIIARDGSDKWVSIRTMQDPVHALMQSYLRTKAHDLKSFRQLLELHTNSSNNTVVADADGDIAFFHGNFIPRRDPQFDWKHPVDGSTPATEWHGLLSVDESANIINPATGWLYNSNNAPWTDAGPSSPKRSDYPSYVELVGDNWRGVHATRLLGSKTDFTVDGLMHAAYDSYLPAFQAWVPALVKAWDGLPASDTLKARVAPQIAVLRDWDFRWSTSSVPTSVAVFWGEELGRRVRQEAQRSGVSVDNYISQSATPQEMVESLAAAASRLANDFGRWDTPWGEINRFQRLDDAIVPHFDDAQPSIPVGFTSARWGSLASFGAQPYPNTKKWYGTAGNSFVAVVEFGDSVRAKAITAGGESGHPGSPHFNDEAERYSTGQLRDVYFYRNQLAGHTQREYHPGDGA